MQDKVYSLLGLATKAGKTRSGSFQTLEAIAGHKACLVILSGDAKENTVHEIRYKCESGGIPLRFYGNKDDLGHAMGKELRSCLAVTDPGLAGAIVRAIDAAGEEAHASER